MGLQMLTLKLTSHMLCLLCPGCWFRFHFFFDFFGFQNLRNSHRMCLRCGPQGPLLRVSHTPRSIRLACTVGDKRRAVKPGRHATSPNTSQAIVVRKSRTVEVYEEPVSSPLYMDFSGSCHSRLNDGGFLFMDQFGHAHSKLDDGGFLYMDRQGSCHIRLDDAAIDHHQHKHKASLHHRPRQHHATSIPVMLGDVSVPQPPRVERIAHDAELKTMQGKAASHMQQRVERPSTATRRNHQIAQPRRHN
mmetsp:Transcript_3020/g.8601  ORF Transcript_3020/g.8601 Transcript_3020/m.8601 type:complete len:247 (-) Transcript_3020:376-1116(-)